MECQQQMAKLQLSQLEFQRATVDRDAAKTLDRDSDVWRNVRLSDLDNFTGRNDSLLPTTWLRAVAKYAKHKRLPDDLWTELATMKLDGRIATQWEGYENPKTGVRADDRMPWGQFRQWLIRKSTDPIAAKKLQDQFIGRTGGLQQVGHIDRCVQAWETWMASMEATDELEGVYTSKAILAQFLSCLKPKTQASLRQLKPADIWDAMNAAQEVDPLLFEAERSPSRTPGPSHVPRGPGSTPGKTPARVHFSSPPGNPVLHSLAAALSLASDLDLAALGFQRTGGRPREGQHPAGGPVTYRGPYSKNNPPPRLSREWRDWCRNNKACFGCREPGSFPGKCSKGCLVFPRINAVDTTTDLIDFAEEPLNE
jgi:hypothetical protein